MFKHVKLFVVVGSGLWLWLCLWLLLLMDGWMDGWMDGKMVGCGFLMVRLLREYVRHAMD